MNALRRAPTCLTLLWFGHLTLLAGQDSGPANGGALIVNLAVDAGSEQKESVGPGTYSIRIINRAPKNTYSITVLVRTIPIPPFSELIPAAQPPDTTTNCGKIAGAIDKLKNTNDEKEAARLVHDLDQALEDALKQGQCKDQAKPVQDAKDLTVRVWEKQVVLESGQEVDVTITRPAGEGKEVKWKHTFSTQPRGEWRLSYGFATVFPLGFNSGNGLVSKPASYFAKQAGSGTYVITKQTDRSGLDVLPVVGYTFMSTNRLNRGVAHSLTAGLGVDLKTPTGVVAYALTYNQNLTLSFGVGFHSEQVLRGTFSPGDTITTNLTPDDLNNNKFRVRPVFMLTLRSLKNPFSAPAAAAEKGKEKSEDKPK